MDGKIPPQAKEIEAAVIGALMIDASIVYLIDDLRPDIFYQANHALIFKAIQALHKRNEPVDILTVTTELKKQGTLDEAGGAYQVSRVTDGVGSGANAEYHTKILLQKSAQRKLIEVSHDLIKRSHEDTTDVYDLVEYAQQTLMDVTNFSTDSLKHISDCVKEVMDVMDRNANSEAKLTGVATGFTKVDRFTNGLQPSDLIVIAGETSQGKTSVALNIAGNAGILGYSIGIWSYEMSEVQIGARLMAQASGVAAKKMLMEKLEEKEFNTIQDKIARLVEANIYIDDVSSNAIDHLERQIRSAVVKRGIQMAIVDYLQLIKNEQRGMNKSVMVGDIANRLKVLAKSLRIPILLLSQLRRSSDHEPTLGRLKESGDIENAADIVWLLWRPELFNVHEIEVAGETVNTHGIGHHIFAKGRNIGLAEFILRYNQGLTMFTDLDPDMPDAVSGVPF